jgi:hypothetical protein
MRSIRPAGARFGPLLLLALASCGPALLETPAKPLGPDSLRLGEAGLFGFRNDGTRIERIAYVVRWGGYGRETTGFVRAGDTAELEHAWADTGLFGVTCRTCNEAGDTSVWSEVKPVRVWWADSAPFAPGPVIGPDTVAAGADSLFGAVTTDPDEDLLTYVFDWGAGDTQEIGWFASGDTARLLHSWQDTGTVMVRVRARDDHGLNSEWSPSRPVRIVP